MPVSSSRSRSDRSKARKRSRRHAREEARGEILDSAARFLRKRHFRDLTVGEVMVETTLRRPAFYQHFTDVHDLIVSLLADIEAISASNCQPMD